MLTIGILALLTGIAVVSYTEYGSSSDEATTKQNLDTLRRTIEMSEATTRRACKSGPVDKLKSLHFAGDCKDPWGNTYYVNSNKKVIYSFGPDRTDNNGDGDDVYIEYHGIEGNPVMDPPRDLVAKGSPESITLTWAPPARQNNLESYKIEKRLDGKTEWKALTTEPLPASEILSWIDTSDNKSMVYYRVIAVYSIGGESKPSQIAGWVPVYK